MQCKSFNDWMDPKISKIFALFRMKQIFLLEDGILEYLAFAVTVRGAFE